MEKKSVRKPIWMVIEPFFYPHSEGYLRAIFQDKSILETFDIVYVYGSETSQRKLMCALGEALGSSFRSIRVDYGQREIFGFGITALFRNWKVIRAAQKLAVKEGAELISILRADDLIRLLIIPGMHVFFRYIRGRSTGVFFNSRCFRESSFTLNILSRGVCRVLKSGFFKKLLVLDHGTCKPIQKRLGPSYDNVIGEAVDPWTEADHVLSRDQVVVEDKRTILTLGAHSIRKGTVCLLRMFRDYPEKLANYKLLVVGPVRDDIREEFDELLSEIKNSSDNVECIDRYVSDSDSWSYFQRSDIVVCPYVNFHGSSNVVIRAAAAGVPVITPVFGFLGEVAEHCGLGVTYENQQPAEILQAIFEVENLLLENAAEIRSNCKKYAQRHHASLYAASLLLPLTDHVQGISRA